jgi:hypothetical protein
MRADSRVFLLATFVVLVPFLGCGDGDGEQKESSAASMMPGWYDFYGTFSDNPEYADGTGTCAIPDPIGCPSVTNFCIYRLRVGEPDARGVQGIAGCSDRPDNPHYDSRCESEAWNVAVGKVYMMPFVVSDWDGGGQVYGMLDSQGGQVGGLSETSMVVEERPGPLPAWRIVSWETSLGASANSHTGTIVLTVPYRNNLKPPPPQDAPPGTYSPPASTSDRAVCRVANPESGSASKAAVGTPLVGGRARLVTPHAIFRTVIGGIIPMGSDVMSVTTWDGTFCRRDEPDETCVPNDFPCPALDD